MVECCGESRGTRFCPDCGAKLTEPTPLYGLLAYCRDEQALAERLATLGFTTLESHRDAAFRWEVWGDALAELLAKAEG